MVQTHLLPEMSPILGKSGSPEKKVIRPHASLSIFQMSEAKRDGFYMFSDSEGISLL